MSKITVTDFTKRTGSPFQKDRESTPERKVVHQEVLQKTNYDKQKEKQNELLQKVNKKAAEYQANKPSSGVFTEVTTHGAFTSKTVSKELSTTSKVENRALSPKSGNGSNGSKTLLGFPSSANDLALDAKSDLESDKNISEEIKEKVIEKLFKLVSIVQHVYESKVRIMTEFEKFKDTHMKNELRREKEHSEQLYKLNMNFQNEVVQAIQRLKSELDITTNISKSLEDSNTENDSRNSSVDFNVLGHTQNSHSVEHNDDYVATKNKTEQSEEENAYKGDKQE